MRNVVTEIEIMAISTWIIGNTHSETFVTGCSWSFLRTWFGYSDTLSRRKARSPKYYQFAVIQVIYS